MCQHRETWGKRKNARRGKTHQQVFFNTTTICLSSLQFRLEIKQLAFRTFKYEMFPCVSTQFPASENKPSYGQDLGKKRRKTLGISRTICIQNLDIFRKQCQKITSDYLNSTMQCYTSINLKSLGTGATKQLSLLMLRSFSENSKELRSWCFWEAHPPKEMYRVLKPAVLQKMEFD